MAELFKNDIDPVKYVEEKGLMIVEDTALIASTIDAVIAEFPQSVADYKDGKEKAFGFMVGQTMRRLQGKGQRIVKKDHERRGFRAESGEPQRKKTGKVHRKMRSGMGEQAGSCTGHIGSSSGLFCHKIGLIQYTIFLL